MAGSKPDVTQEELDKFQMFLFEMDDVLEDFIRSAAEKGYTLDYSLTSLSELERYWLAEQQGPDADRLKGRCGRYLGEVFRKNVGGKWKLCLDRPDHFYYKLPVIYGFEHPDVVFCPTQMFTNFTNRRTAGFLQGLVQRYQDDARKWAAQNPG